MLSHGNVFAARQLPETSAACQSLMCRQPPLPLWWFPAMKRLEELNRDLAQLQKKRSPTQGSGREMGGGREAEHPGEIPPRGWIDVLWRGWGEVSDQNLFLIAGGVTYALLLALFPA